MGKRARNLVAINSHADLFSSAAYQCLQQESMSFDALSRFFEAVAKSIKYAIAMSTILAILAIEAFSAQIFQWEEVWPTLWNSGDN